MKVLGLEIGDTGQPAMQNVCGLDNEGEVAKMPQLEDRVHPRALDDIKFWSFGWWSQWSWEFQGCGRIEQLALGFLYRGRTTQLMHVARPLYGLALTTDPFLFCVRQRVPLDSAAWSTHHEPLSCMILPHGYPHRPPWPHTSAARVSRVLQFQCRLCHTETTRMLYAFHTGTAGPSFYCNDNKFMRAVLDNAAPIVNLWSLFPLGQTLIFCRDWIVCSKHEIVTIFSGLRHSLVSFWPWASYRQFCMWLECALYSNMVPFSYTCS